MKVTINGYVTYTKYPWEEKPTYGFNTFDPSEYIGEWSAVMMQHSFDVEVPENFDMRPGQIAALKAKKEKVQAEFAAKVKEIDEQINSLLAIEA